MWVETRPHILLPQFISSAFFFFPEGVQDRSHSSSCFWLYHRVVASKTAADPQLWALVGKTLTISLSTILSFSCCQHSMLKSQYFIFSKHRSPAFSQHWEADTCLQLQFTIALQPLSRNSLAKCALQSFTHIHFCLLTPQPSVCFESHEL